MSQLFNGRHRPSPTVDLTMLPSDILSLWGDPFYSLVEELTSNDIEDLLRIQKISTARCFLNTKPLAFFDINSEDPSVVQLQTRLSFKTTDNKIVVLAGVHGYLRYLQELFRSLVNKKSSQRSDTKKSSIQERVHQVPSSGIDDTIECRSPNQS